MLNICELAREKMNPADIDHHGCDLYLCVNDISRALVAEYDHKWMVETFISNIEPHVLWYDIPFAWTPEREA